MKYVLIFVWVQGFGSGYPSTSSVAEFNSLPACQAAAREIVKQGESRKAVQMIVCAAKG